MTPYQADSTDSTDSIHLEARVFFKSFLLAFHYMMSDSFPVDDIEDMSADLRGMRLVFDDACIYLTMATCSDVMKTDYNNKA